MAAVQHCVIDIVMVPFFVVMFLAALPEGTLLVYTSYMIIMKLNTFTSPEHFVHVRARIHVFVKKGVHVVHACIYNGGDADCALVYVCTGSAWYYLGLTVGMLIMKYFADMTWKQPTVEIDLIRGPELHFMYNWTQ